MNATKSHQTLCTVVTEDDLFWDHWVGVSQLQVQLLFPQKCLVYPFSLFKKVTFDGKQMAGCLLRCITVIFIFIFLMGWG